MLEGKNVNLRVMEKEDMPLVTEWLSNPEFAGDYVPLRQESKSEMEKKFDDVTADKKWFIIEKKDGSKVGLTGHFPTAQKLLEIGFALIPSERGKGYCSEAVKIMVDYLFLSKDIVRIQAHTDLRNVASQKVLERVGFKKEGTIRKFSFIRGKWRDMLVYSILREEWKEPKVLTTTASQSRRE